MNSYYRVTYKNKDCGYYEDQFPEIDSQERQYLEQIFLKCKKIGLIVRSNEQFDEILIKLIPQKRLPRKLDYTDISGIYVELRTLTNVG